MAGSEQFKARFVLRSTVATRAAARSLAWGRFRGSELVAEIRAEDLHGVARQAACVPSSAWRKRDFSNAPSPDGNTRGSPVGETLWATTTGPSAGCHIVPPVPRLRVS